MSGSMSRFRSLVLASAVGLAAIFVASCSTQEVRLRPPAFSPQPSWIMSPQEPKAGERYYVGLAIAENVLEEQQGRRRAITNAAELVAQSIANEVEGRLASIDTTEGAAHRGEEDKKAKIVEEVKARTSEIVSAMNPKEYYYERWQITSNWWDRLWDSGFERYKYYVLCTYPQTQYDRLVQMIQKKVE